jgi:hypothetical protein
VRNKLLNRGAGTGVGDALWRRQISQLSECLS